MIIINYQFLNYSIYSFIRKGEFMMQILKADKRGISDHGWLYSRHTFSFADFYNPNQMGFSVLRVINEDHIMGGTGFDTHEHRDMEIISYVLEGALEHKDSLGDSTIIKPGEVQRMSAGTGIRHSEYNHLKDSPTHFLQIWILPEAKGITPSYEQKNFAKELSSGDVILVASKNGKNNSITLNQDVDIYICKSKDNGKKNIVFKKDRHICIQLINGEIEILNEKLNAGDLVALSEISSLFFSWKKNSEFMIFDLP
jgi:redox-sensitive bicupin YhaK (pirin superfamily)